MNLSIVPYEAVGPIMLGMSKAEVRDVITGQVEEFTKSPNSKIPTDNFVGRGIHVYYRIPGICNAVEMASPADPTFRGHQLIGVPFDQLSEYFQHEDPALELDSCGMTSKLLGLGLYVPDLEDTPSALVRGVIVFEKNYYG